LNRSRKDFEILVDQKGGKINLDDFILFMEYHQSMLFPIFDIQLHLRRKILGFKFWDSCAKRRVEISHGKSLTIREIIELEAINHSTDFIVKAQGVETKEGKIAMDNLGNQHHRRGSKDNSIHQEQQHPPMHHNGKFKISKESSYSNILFVLAPSFQEVDDLLNQRHPSMAPELADALNKQRHQQQQEEKTESQDHNKDHPPTRKTSLHPTAKHDSFALMDNEVRKLELEGKNHSIHEPQRHHSTEYRDVPFREKDIDDHKHDRRRSKEQLLDQIMDEEREKQSTRKSQDHDSSFHVDPQNHPPTRRKSKENNAIHHLPSHSENPSQRDTTTNDSNPLPSRHTSQNKTPTVDDVPTIDPNAVSLFEKPADWHHHKSGSIENTLHSMHELSEKAEYKSNFAKSKDSHHNSIAALNPEVLPINQRRRSKEFQDYLEYRADALAPSSELSAKIEIHPNYVKVNEHAHPAPDITDPIDLPSPLVSKPSARIEQPSPVAPPHTYYRHEPPVSTVHNSNGGDEILHAPSNSSHHNSHHPSRYTSVDPNDDGNPDSDRYHRPPQRRKSKDDQSLHVPTEGDSNQRPSRMASASEPVSPPDQHQHPPPRRGSKGDNHY
jgi:hypothetical protein